MRSFWYPIGVHFFRISRILRNNCDQWARRAISDHWGARGSESGGVDAGDGANRACVSSGPGGICAGLRWEFVTRLAELAGVEWAVGLVVWNELWGLEVG